jgi:mercuric ion binding protein
MNLVLLEVAAMKKNLFTIFITAVAILLAGLAQARVSSLRVAVDGMSCPFCAFGVEKRLKTVAGTASVAVDMQNGTATITAGAEDSIRYQDVPKAVKEAGFTARDINVTADGTIVKGKNGGLVLRADDYSLPLKWTDSGMKMRLESLAGIGKAVVIDGPLSPQGGGSWLLIPETLAIN